MLYRIAERDSRDERDRRGVEVRSSRFWELRTLNLGSRFSRMSYASRFDWLTDPSHVEGLSTVCSP
jgi:hypothetical protein